MTSGSRAGRLRRPRPVILVDTREQTPLLFTDAVATETAGLVTGDYSCRGCTELVAIERKSLPDLVACVGVERERFMEQVSRLLAVPIRALVVEATWEALASGAYCSQTNPRSVTGTVLSLVARGLPVLLVGDARGASEAVERLLVRVFKQQFEQAQAFMQAQLAPTQTTERSSPI